MKYHALKPASYYNLNATLFIKNIMPQLRRVRNGVFKKKDDNGFAFAGLQYVDLTNYFINTRHTLSDTITLLHVMLKRGMNDKEMGEKYSLKNIYEYCFSRIASEEIDFVEHAGGNEKSVGSVEVPVAENFVRVALECFLKFFAICCSGTKWQDMATRTKICNKSSIDALLTTSLPTDNPDNSMRLLISPEQKILTDLAFTMKRHRNTLSHADVDDKEFFFVPADEDERKQFHADTYSTLLVLMLMLVEHRFEDVMAAVCTEDDINTDIKNPFTEEELKKAHAYIRNHYSQPLRQHQQTIIDEECSPRLPLIPMEQKADNNRIVICDVSGSGKTVYLRHCITDAEDSRLRFFVNADELNDDSVKGAPMAFVRKAISQDIVYLQVGQRERDAINHFVESGMMRSEDPADDGTSGANKVEIYIDAVTHETVGFVEKIAKHYSDCVIIATTDDTNVAERLAGGDLRFCATGMQRFSNSKLLAIMSMISLDRRKVDHGEILLKYYKEAFDEYELKGLPQFATIAARTMEDHEMYVGDYFNETRFCRQLTKYFKEENPVIAKKLENVKLFQQVRRCQDVAQKICTDKSISTIDHILSTIHYPLSLAKIDEPRRVIIQLRRLFEQLEIIAEESDDSTVRQKAEKFSTLITVRMLHDGIDTKQKKSVDSIPYANANLSFLTKATRTLREEKLPVQDIRHQDIMYRPSPRYIVDRMILNILNVMQQRPITTLRREHCFPAVKRVFDLAAQAGGEPLAKLFTPYWMELWLFNYDEDESNRVYGHTKSNQYIKYTLSKIVMESPHQTALFMHLAHQLTWLRAIPDNSTNKVIATMLNNLILPQDRKPRPSDDSQEDLIPRIVPMNDEELEQVVFRLQEDYPGDYRMTKLANDCILAMKKLRIVDRFAPQYLVRSDKAFKTVLDRCHQDPKVVELMTGLLSRLPHIPSTPKIVRDIVTALVSQCCVNSQLLDFLATADANIVRKCRGVLCKMPLPAIPQKVRDLFFEDKEINRFIIDRVYTPCSVPEDVNPLTAPQYFSHIHKDVFIQKGKEKIPVRSFTHYVRISDSSDSRLRVVTEGINTNLVGKCCVETDTGRKFRVEQMKDAPDRIAEIMIVLPSSSLSSASDGYLCFSDSNGCVKKLQYTSVIHLTDRRWILRITNESLISKFLDGAERDENEYGDDCILRNITDNDILKDDYVYIEQDTEQGSGISRSYVKVTNISIVNDTEDRTLLVLTPADKRTDELPAKGELKFYSRFATDDVKNNKKERDKRDLPLILSLNPTQRSLRTKVDDPMMFRSFVEGQRMLAFDEFANVGAGQWIQWNDDRNTTEQIVSCFRIYNAWEVTLKKEKWNDKLMKKILPTQFFTIEGKENCDGICSIYKKNDEWRCMLMFLSSEARSINIPIVLKEQGNVTLADKNIVHIERKRDFKPYNNDKKALCTLVCTMKADGAFPEKYLKDNHGAVIKGKFDMLIFNPYRTLCEAKPEPVPKGTVKVSSMIVEMKNVILEDGKTVQRIMFPEILDISKIRSLQYGIKDSMRKFPMLQRSVATDGYIQLEVAEECRQIWSRSPRMRIYFYTKEGQPAYLKLGSYMQALNGSAMSSTYHTDVIMDNG